ncbi:MAG: SDR family oxidoreductase [Colwellia sp.]|jgi:dTDP-4-dehydrorhamnose reductase
MSKKILILGANGMLGGSLHRYFSRDTGHHVLGSVRSESALEHLASMGFDNVESGVDVTNQESLQKLIAEFRPDFVFNCIGLIKQLSQSKLPVPAIEINSLLPHRLAALCTEFGARLVHFSTDCVFSGNAGGYTESSIPDATDIYGRSKLLGEVDYDDHITLRTSIIGHELNSGVSLVDWFLNQSGHIKGFSKAVFSGLPTCYVAEFINKNIISSPNFSGLYHLSSYPIDKYTLLQLIKGIYGLEIEIEHDSDFVIDRSLNSDILRASVGFTPLPWSELIERMHNEYIEYFK